MRVIGYISSLAGVFLLLSTKFPQLTEKLSSILKFIPKENFSKYVIYLGGGLIVLGIILLLSSLKRSNVSSSHQEVPIYQGNKIVGYRRH